MIANTMWVHMTAITRCTLHHTMFLFIIIFSFLLYSKYYTIFHNTVFSYLFFVTCNNFFPLSSTCLYSFFLLYMVGYNFVTTLVFFLLKDFFSYVSLFMISVISRIIVTASHSKIIIPMSPKSHHRYSTRQNTGSDNKQTNLHKQSTS